ncbi:hypothetical protein CPT34_08460 [Rhizobium sophoriradicis]|uniref:Uncharacterized protein n=1 Tax=Rhizobium sophoriradicis TaxID=1535245 RepID=A0A2A5KW24_9HYPH|nr:hypothetical protein CPT34_08460 [Rhizobium sophoriradicis]
MEERRRKERSGYHARAAAVTELGGASRSFSFDAYARKLGARRAGVASAPQGFARGDLKRRRDARCASIFAAPSMQHRPRGAESDEQHGKAHDIEPSSAGV